jgi:hypothetical protein
MQRNPTMLVLPCTRPGIAKSIPISVFLATLILLVSSSLFGQQITASLSGTVTDPSGAAIPNAAVEIKNDLSGDIRRTTTNSDGVFAVIALPPGSYSVKVTEGGFTPYGLHGVVLTQGDSRALDRIILTVGAVKEEVSVIAAGASVVPMDTGEVSTTLNQTMVDEFTLSGRDAGELMKIMPGMGTNNGLSGNASFNGSDHVTGSNTGPAGNFSANGTVPHGGMSYMLDGANLLDNNMGTQIANINPEMVSEAKMLMSSYGPEFAKGPVVFQAISKSGGKNFHGEGYLFARNSIFNAEDSYQKNQGNTATDSHYYYPGGNVGGPVTIPGIPFNKQKDKLFFWFGYEYMDQHPAGSLAQYFVPTTQMMQGNFSPSYLATLTAPGGWGNAFNVPCANNSTQNGCANLSLPGGMIPQNLIDPNGLAYMKLFPTATAQNGAGYNYSFNDTLPQNRWEQAERVDYSISDNTKLSVTYTYQLETDHHPIDTWWAPNQALPYPSPMDAKTPSSVLSGNFTKVFSASLVNEFVASYGTYLNTTFPNDPSKVDPTTLGFTYKGLFGANEKQFADLLSWSGGTPDYMPQASFYGPGFQNKFGAHKYDPSFSDNLSKVWGTHTLKFGFYWATMGNKQSTTGYEGQFEVETYGNTTTNNTLADLLLGHAQSYQQTNDILAVTWQTVQHSLYAQDSWKVNRRLTVNYGIRMDHIGQWYDPNGKGAIVWDPAIYSTASPSPANTGIAYNAINSSIPLSGWSSPVYYPSPRFSAAYDLFGNAKTVLRGGAALFYFTQGGNSGADAASLGQFTWSTSNNGTALTSFAQINSLTGVPTAGGSLNGGNINPYDMNDNKMPHTWDYNFTISQALPFRSVAEFSYVGSRSRDMQIGTTNGPGAGMNNVNGLPLGTLFKPDPKTGVIPCIQGVGCSGVNLSDYFPYPAYGNIILSGHGSYSNYDSFQATWTRSVKPVVVVANYVFGKVLGTHDGLSGNGSDNSGAVDGLVLANNYGPEAYDHTHIFNLAYSVDLPKIIRGSNYNALGKAINGWTLSGWTGIQSGTPLEANAVGFNANWPSGVSAESYLGTNSVVLMPAVICNPTKNLSSGQYFNPACFAAPAPGTQGTQMWPYIHGPAVINSDMSLFKNIQLTENMKVQFRLEAFNFLNHPNAAFTVQNNGDLQLNFNNNGTLSTTNINGETDGKPAFTVGNRLVELAVKFYF